MALPSETVAVPIVKGLDVTTDARLVSPPSLLEAVNSRFGGGGAKKRRGHEGVYVRGEGEPLGLDLPAWIWGVGILTARGAGDEDVDYWTSTVPDAAQLYGVGVRDSETLLWDGFRLFSYLPSQDGAQNGYFANVGNAVLPSLNAFSTAKHNLRQSQPEMADNGLTRIVAWIDDTEPTKLTRYQVQDSTSGTIIAEGTLAATDPVYLRACTMENWMHVFVLDGDAGVLRQFSIVSAEPNDITVRSLGEVSGGHFDLWKMTDSLTLVVKSHEGAIHGYFIQSNGAGSSSRDTFVFTPAGSTAVTLVSCSVSHYDGINDLLGNYVSGWPPGTVIGKVVLAWLSPGQHIGVAILDEGNDLMEEGTFTSNIANTKRLTVAPRIAWTSDGYELWDLFWDTDDGTTKALRRTRFYDTGAGIAFGTQVYRWGLQVASRAWRIGDRTFLWGASDSEVQNQWYLLDEGLSPVGHMEFGLANLTTVAGGMAGVNWSGSSASQYTLHMALSHKLRVNRDDATSTVYTEPGVKAVYLDFLPSLRTAQAGRTLYMAGAQLWAYDGREVVEAGFHSGPEVTLEPDSGGGLTADGTYSYRVDVCYRNAQNEEVRSLSILSDSLVLTGANQTINVTIPPVLTRRENSYFLIYRNAMSSGLPLANWWLLNSRDPGDADYLPNTQGGGTQTFVDDGSVDDTDIQLRETHPAGDTYLQPVSAPACEVIAAGRDRLWVAGGELLPGEVAPSRLFNPGETPSFNAYLNIQVDRSDEPVTAVGFMGEVAALFRPNSTYLLDSDGPDNNASGFWNPPRLALADIGAVSQESVVRIASGLVFQSPAGFRLLGPGGALSAVGQPVDTIARGFEVVGSMVVEKDQEARFYGATACLVYNYLYDTWSRWTVGGSGVAKNPDTELALVARENGYLWVETDGTWIDGGGTYTHRIRTSWLRAGQLGDFHRVRRVGGIGRYADLTLPSHSLRLEFYYDSREFWEDRHEWTLPDSTTNQDTWGSGTWGSGVWGDTTATISNLEDLTWDWQKDPAIQKCNCISIALEDYNTNGPGFELAALTLELARKSGLDRGPTRTGTGSYR